MNLAETEEFHQSGPTVEGHYVEMGDVNVRAGGGIILGNTGSHYVHYGELINKPSGVVVFGALI